MKIKKWFCSNCQKYYNNVHLCYSQTKIDGKLVEGYLPCCRKCMRPVINVHNRIMQFIEEELLEEPWNLIDR